MDLKKKKFLQENIQIEKTSKNEPTCISLTWYNSFIDYYPADAKILIP